jgi:3-dehydroquinate synthase
MVRLDVTSERGQYPVLVGPGLSRQLPDLLKLAGVAGSGLVISSPAIWNRHAPRLRRPGGFGAAALVADGERAKTLASVARLYEACVERRLDRGSTIIAFGGGVIGDVAGFVAATYLRGLALVQVPTTLLAQVDSAIGGKVGVNLASGKNLVGAFHAPALVVCDPELLSTLVRREFRAGLYEVVKYGLIASPDLLARVEANLDAIFTRDPAVLTPIIVECCRIKAEVVSRDERESGLRRVLNFGHTVGHALESVTRYRRFRHGEAIAYGMLAAAHLSVARGSMTAAQSERLRTIIERLGPLPAVADVRAGEALDVIRRDKKVVDGRLHYVLALGVGATRIVSDVTERELSAAMKSIGLT